MILLVIALFFPWENEKDERLIKEEYERSMNKMKNLGLMI
jgi:hypothetical protein